MTLIGGLSLAGCGGGGGGGSSSGGSPSTPSYAGTSGVVVDPYVIGALVEEVDADGKIIQSTITDGSGAYRFDQPLTVGSTLRLKKDSLGMHSGVPYTVVLTRLVREGDAEPLVISPLTTLLAGGMSSDALISDLGLSGLTAEALYDDPMALPADPSEANWPLLQAAMAVGRYLEDSGNPLPVDKNVLAGRLATVKSLVNATSFRDVKESLSSDPQVTDILLADFIHAAVRTLRDHSTELNRLSAYTKNVYMARIGGPSENGISGEQVYLNQCQSCHNLNSGGVMDLSAKGALAQSKLNSGHQGIVLGVDQQVALYDYLDGLTPVPPPTPDPVDGQALYDNKCSFCHGVTGYDGLGFPDLAGGGAMVSAKFSGGSHYLMTLNEAEQAAIAEFVNLYTPATPPPPPAPIDGTALYGSACAACHGPLANGSLAGVAADGIQAAIDDDLGGMGSLSSLTSAQIQAIADVLSTVTPPPPPNPADGKGLYDAKCAGCHALTGYDASGFAPDLAGDGTKMAAKFAAAHNGISLTAAEQTALAGFLDSYAPAPPPAPTDGKGLYDADCAGCHAVNGYDAIGSPDLAGSGSNVAAKFAAAHNGISLTAAEQTALAGFLDSYAPAPPPAPTDGKGLYDADCAGCHAVNGYDAIGSPDLAGSGSNVAAKFAGTHNGISLSAAEKTALAGFLDSYAPAPPPAPTDGKGLYDADCAGCHAVNGYDASGSPDLAGSGSNVAAKFAGTHNGISLSAAEKTALAGFLDQYQQVPGGPDYSNCTACHGQPPAGAAFPNIAGAHAVHQALPGLANQCATCHATAAHNDLIDLAFPAGTPYSAKTGAATANVDTTCSNVSCHGGQKTPNWQTGTINVDTQCSSCHVRGTTQYNSYNSGEHKKHVDKGIACIECHDTLKMGGHFAGLATTGFTNPAATIKSNLNYVGGSCTLTCHSEKHSNENWR